METAILAFIVFLVQASSSVLDLIATQSAGILFLFSFLTHSLFGKNHSDLSKSTSKELYLSILSEKFLQNGGWKGKQRDERRTIQNTQTKPVCLLLLCSACND